MPTYWYVATLIIVSRVENKPEDSKVCAEQIRLLRAQDADEAYEKALQLGHAEEHSYINMNGNTLFWEFVGLENLEQLEEKRIRDGREIRNRFFEHNKPESLTSSKERLAVYLASKPHQSQESKLLNEHLPVD